MAKTTKAKTPIMTPAEERFMAFEGLVQWTQAVVTQSARISVARGRQFSDEVMRDQTKRRQAIYAFHAECHFFAVAAHKLLEFRDWVLVSGLCNSVNFGEINQFCKQDIKDLRDMREHVHDYFIGVGKEPTRWVFEAPDGSKTDASAVSGTMIGGRLDWIKFGAAAERLLSKLLAEPTPFPP
jgi:hypothetical protein